MAINITFADFDTVCYSNQHNIIELINHAVGISIELNLFGAQIGNIQQEIDNIKDTVDDAGEFAGNLAGRLNTLVLRVNSIESDLATLQHNYDVFSYAVNQDIKSLSDRITALGG